MTDLGQSCPRRKDSLAGNLWIYWGWNSKLMSSVESREHLYIYWRILPLLLDQTILRVPEGMICLSASMNLVSITSGHSPHHPLLFNQHLDSLQALAWDQLRLSKLYHQAKPRGGIRWNILQENLVMKPDTRGFQTMPPRWEWIVWYGIIHPKVLSGGKGDCSELASRKGEETVRRARACESGSGIVQL